MSAGELTVVWFREDLRLADNAALAWAAERGPVVAVVIDEDPEVTGHRPAGKASQWWWNKSVSLLAKSLADHGVPLLRAAGDPHKLIAELVERLDAAAISWNRRYAAPLSHVDEGIERNLSAVSRDVRTFAGHLLTEPDQVTTAEGGPYKVFTPFSRRAWPVAEEYVESLIGEGQTSPAKLHGPDKDIDPGDEWTSASHSDHGSTSYHGSTSDHGGDVNDCDHLERHWRPGEEAASAALLRFIDASQPRIDGYVKDRDLPAVAATSRLSPYLRFGEISVHRIWYEVERAHSQGEVNTEDADTFRTELLWRDFAWHRLHHHPDMALRNMRQEFGHFDWQWDPGPGVLKAWQTGHTGIPLVDAGMRELAATGTMHNRVRMVVASFLTKNLLVHWRRGEEWFWDNLVDADPASNPFNWQWVAGCGDDASPYFRIFNPETQRKKFDPEDTYVARWVPELGTSRYPEPIVDLKESRQEALDAYQLMRNSRQ